MPMTEPTQASFLRFCPRCGSDKFKACGIRKSHCNNCSFEFFLNTATAACVYLLDENKQVLFVRRAKDPAKGKLGLAGGFVDFGENAEEGLLRELDEELGTSQIKHLSYLMSASNIYTYKDFTYSTVDLFFTAQLKYPEQASAKDEVLELVWKNPAEVRPQDLAFVSLCRVHPHLLRALNLVSPHWNLKVE